MSIISIDGDDAERVQVDGDEVDGGDVEALEVGDVVRVVAVGEDAAVHLRVQRDDAVAEHLRRAGDRFDGRVGNARFSQRFGGATAGHDLPPEVNETLGERGHAGLVIHREECPHDSSSISFRIASG